jgi:hypothetical protein
MATNIPQEDFHKTGLRLPKDLHERLHDAASVSGRSYNSEILARLQQSFDPASPDDAALAARLTKVVEASALGSLDQKLRAGVMARLTLRLLDALQAAGEGHALPEDVATQLRQYAGTVADASDQALAGFGQVFASVAGDIGTGLAASDDMQAIADTLQKLIAHSRAGR